MASHLDPGNTRSSPTNFNLSCIAEDTPSQVSPKREKTWRCAESIADTDRLQEAWPPKQKMQHPSTCYVGYYTCDMLVYTYIQIDR